MTLGSSAVQVQVKRLDHGRDLPLPRLATAHSAGMDLHAAVDKPTELAVGQRQLIATGLAMAIEPGFEGQVRPRSGLAVKQGLTVVNSPGTIDADYRGEIKVALINLGQETVTIKRGDRIAQLVIAAVPRVELKEVDELPQTDRGAGGFGSTGVAQ